MSTRRFQDQEHLFRIAGLFLAGLVVFLALRFLLVPKGFGLYGHFRAGALDDNRATPLVHAGRETCAACHSDAADALKAGKHTQVACEACHGAQAAHAEADDPSAKKPARPQASLCPVCHQANVAKPASFPQVDPKEHAGSTSCFACHRPHDPGEAPQEVGEGGSTPPERAGGPGSVATAPPSSRRSGP
jgi:hypothetical protein